MTTVAKSGKVAGAAGLQHADLYRKLLLRRALLADAVEGAAYVPYIGDGDIALELYADRLVMGADLDPARVEVASSRLGAGGDIRVADCEGPYPFADRAEPVAVADLDAYSNPYLALVAFWETAPKAARVVIFGTDGLRMTMLMGGRTVALPSGKATKASSRTAARTFYNGWWRKSVIPFLEETVAPWRVVRTMQYRRDRNVLYWGIVVEAPYLVGDHGPEMFVPVKGAARTSTGEVKSRAPGWRTRGEVKRLTSEHYRAQVAKRVQRRHLKVKPLTRGKRLAILERDAWMCWICGDPIDRELRHPDRMSASVDHIVAVASGGSNDDANLAAAHLGCNGRKRSRVSTPSTEEGVASAEIPAPAGVHTQAEVLPPAPPEDSADVHAVEAALKEAALSGNVPAGLAWLEVNAPERWGKRKPGALVPVGQTQQLTAAAMAAALGYVDDDE